VTPAFQSINQSISLLQATRPINTQTHRSIGRQTHTYRNREIKRQVARDTNVHTQKHKYTNQHSIQMSIIYSLVYVFV